MKSWLRTLGALLMLVSAQAFAQTTTHSVYLNTDADPTTGCTVVTGAGNVVGAEVRITATVGGSPPMVLWVSRARCIDGVFGNAPQVVAGYPVGLNLGIDAADVVEFSTGRVGLGVGGTVPVVFVSTDGTHTELLEANLVLPAPVPGEGGQGEWGGAVAVPGLGGFALLFLTGLIIWRVWRHPGMGATLVVIVMVGSMGLAWAANFVSDGRIPDWAGVTALAASPAQGGDAEAGTDIRRVFAATENGRVFFRTDVRNLGNPGDPPVDPPTNPPVNPPGNHAPTLAAASFSLPENSPNGTVVGTVVGSDQDGQTLTYSITGGNTSNAFSIGAGTGVIQVANTAAINFEVNPSFNLVVSVSDGSLSASRSFPITLLDVAEPPGNNPPTLAAVSFTLLENSPNGTVVGTVVGSDPDGQPLTYSIAGATPSGAFVIHPTTGVITVANSALIDYEVNPSLSLTVSVSDGSLSATATVTVNLQDVVESPGNHAPTLDAVSFNLLEKSPNGTVVGTVVGNDQDGQTLTYSIVGANPSGAFLINPTTGVITVANSALIDYQVNPSLSLTVSVSDGSLSASATVTVNLQNSNVGAYHLNGTCGVLGLIGPGFTLTAGPNTPLPIGTKVTINGTGLADIGVFSVTGGLASVAVLSGTSRQITLTSAVPAGATIDFRTLLSITVAFTLNATTVLPTGYTASGAVKPAGSVSSTLIFCSAT